MKQKFLFAIMIVIGLLSFVGCSSEEETKSNEDKIQESIVEQAETNVEAELEIYYDANDTINRYLNNYNSINPHTAIEKDMFEVYHHHGKEHNNQIIMYRDDYEIVISDIVNLEVVINGKSVDNESYRVMFKEFAKGYDTTLTDDILDNYWQQLLDDTINDVEFEEFECDLTIFQDKIEYMKLSGKIK